MRQVPVGRPVVAPVDQRGGPHRISPTSNPSCRSSGTAHHRTTRHLRKVLISRHGPRSNHYESGKMAALCLHEERAASGTQPPPPKATKADRSVGGRFGFPYHIPCCASRWHSPHAIGLYNIQASSRKSCVHAHPLRTRLQYQHTRGIRQSHPPLGSQAAKEGRHHSQGRRGYAVPSAACRRVLRHPDKRRVGCTRSSAIGEGTGRDFPPAPHVVSSDSGRNLTRRGSPRARPDARS